MAAQNGRPGYSGEAAADAEWQSLQAGEEDCCALHLLPSMEWHQQQLAEQLQGPSRQSVQWMRQRPLRKKCRQARRC